MRRGRAIVFGGLVALAACTAFKESAPTPPTGDAGAGPKTDAGASTTDGSTGAVDETRALERPWRYVFVTSDMRDAKMGTEEGTGIEKADRWCRARAQEGDDHLHDRTWVAWLSTAQQNARDRIDAFDGRTKFEYRLVTGAEVFGRGVLLERPPTNTIHFNDKGIEYPTAELVWTGTLNSGEAGDDGKGKRCGDWTLTGNTDKAILGSTEAADGWSDEKVSDDCSIDAHVYCFEAP